MLGLVLAATPSFAGDPAMEITQELLGDVKFDVAVKLVEPGSGPKTVVRYAPKVGARVDYVIRTKTGMDLTLQGPDGQPMTMPMGQMMPTTVMTMRNTVGKPVANGMVPVRIEQVDVQLEGAAPELAAQMQASLALTRGMAFDLLVDPATGKLVQLDVAPGVDPALGDLVQGMADQLVQQMAAFPDAPIAKGAKWTTDTDLSMSGIQMRATQTSTVTGISADALDLDVATTLRIAEGPMQLPGLPPGAQVDITRFTGAGTGRMRVELGSLATTGTMSLDLDMGMKMAAPGQPPMEMSMKMTQQTETKLK